MSTIPRKLFRSYHRYRIPHLSPATCRYRSVQRELQRLIREGQGEIVMERTATSIEGRLVPLLRYGSGPSRVLLWSQMHGDEPTATLALLDILSFFVRGGPALHGMTAIPKNCSLFFIPMLNPDGAERVERHTAGRVDMNRDARRLATPEARFLRDTQRRIRPAFAFNLHDQALSTAGEGPELAAIAVLAPSPDGSGTVTRTRRRAMQMGATFVDSIRSFAPGLLATYDDAHEPRAFGDAMQRWGASTLLVESGHYRGDREKKHIRKLNYVGLLSVLYAIAAGSLRKSRVSLYKELPVNGKRGYDLIIKNVMLTSGQNWKRRVSVGFEAKRGRSGYRYYVREVGDLDGFGAVEKATARGIRVPSGRIRIDQRLSEHQIWQTFQIRPKHEKNRPL